MTNGFEYEQSSLLKEDSIFHKFKVLSFAIVASLYIFLVPTSSAIAGGHVVTPTPGETVGPGASPPIAYNWFADPNKTFEGVAEPHRTRCEMLLAGYTLEENKRACEGAVNRDQKNCVIKYCGNQRGCSACSTSSLSRQQDQCERDTLNAGTICAYDDCFPKLPEWRDGLGLGTDIRYIQYTGGYCYYYEGGTSSAERVGLRHGGTTQSSRRDDQVIQRANNGVA